MNPRLEIDLEKIRHNAATLVGQLAPKGIAVTGVTKAALGSPEVAQAMVKGGVSGLGDSRIENVEALRQAGVAVPLHLIRSPMPSQVQRVVAAADVSFNTEIDVIKKLSTAAQAAGLIHGIVLMVELGDLREGIMPENLAEAVREVIDLPGIKLQGLGTNLACQSGATPDPTNMAELSALADAIEASFDIHLETVSGGNSANLTWAFDNEVGRVNELRLGESILLGRETLRREPIEGLFTDAITLHAEAIESKLKPSKPWGSLAQTAFGSMASVADKGLMQRSILAIGAQDCDPAGMSSSSVEVMGGSSDHLMVEGNVAVGSEVKFQLNYSCLLRAMTSPFVAKTFLPLSL